MSVPRATYRVQLHRGFTFRDAQAIVPYLAALGISHLYASPFLKARAGSRHGYDVVDHESLNPEIGTREDLDALVEVLHAHRMSLMLDLVPNHMGVLKADNRWWQDVLEHGRASRHAEWFDIDWTPESPELEGKVLVPILGDQYGTVLERGELALRLDAAAGELALWYYEHRLPIRPAEYPRLIVPGLDRLAREQGVTATTLGALREIAAAFAAVPGGPDAPAANGRDPAPAAADAKQRLAQACASLPAVARHLEANVQTLNGIPGEPASFDALHALIKGQCYRLSYWRVAADDINYRRFFDVNDLAALRQEVPEVFEATHGLVLDLVRTGAADALRIDHPDGLWDPAAYFARLQTAAAAVLPAPPLDPARGRAVYLVVEKILAGHERMPEEWPVHGTTGYRFLNVVNGLFVDPGARARFERLYAAFTGESASFDDVLRRSKALIAVHALASDLNRLATTLARIAKRDRHTCDFTRNAIRRALVDVVAAFPIYRTYVTPAGRSDDDRRFVDWAIGVARRQSVAAEQSVYDYVGAVLRGGPAPVDPEVAQDALRFVMRFQQFTAPVTAKGMEDTSFYVFNRLASLNEVGGDPRVFGFSLNAFHAASQDRAQRWPHTMLATATHDTKRGEDTRVRIDVLSEMPAGWRLALRRWRQVNRRHRSTVDGMPAPARNDEYLLYQTLLGTWPLTPLDDDALARYRERIQAYMQKAVREAKQHTSWVNPNPDYEDALTRFIDGLLGSTSPNRFLADFAAAQARVAQVGAVNGLAQVALKYLSPGVPDTYQGTELWDLALVDPDNRRPVDYAQRERWLREMAAWPARDAAQNAAQLLTQWRDGRVKLWLSMQCLALRERHAWLATAGYLPVLATGAQARSICAFARTAEGRLLVVVVPRLWLGLVPDAQAWPLGEAAWHDTRLPMPPGPRRWRNVLTRDALELAAAGAPPGSGEAPSLRVADVLADFPVALLEPE
jgi:(1->4)-alpha-D-glucan 1-alpha-D-glucosylmutase